MDRRFHEVAQIFPLLQGDEFRSLKDDILENGLLESIWLHPDGSIVDGRNRYRACMDLGIDPTFRVWDGKGSLVSFVVSLNLHRRHLTSSQRATLAVEILPMLEEEAREEKLSKLKQGATVPVPQKIAEREQGESREHAAAILNTNRQYVSDAKRIKAASPEIFEQVKVGDLTIPEAKRKVKKEKEEKGSAPTPYTPTGGLITPNVKQGEWYQLGPHLLYCGDTSEMNFAGKIPQCSFAFADPPYNANVAEWDTDFVWQHDWLIDKAKIVAVTPGIESMQQFYKNSTSMPYAWSMAVWIKNGMTRGKMGFSNWIYVALFSRESIYRQAQDFLSVTIKTSETDDSDHKGRKPSEMIEKLIKLFSSPGETIVDPFLGSGTTLFEADNCNRVCIGGEINPDFCNKIIMRWQDKTGVAAKHV